MQGPMCEHDFLVRYTRESFRYEHEPVVVRTTGRILVRFFEKTDMARLVDHQTKFWSTLLGGPASYDREQLAVLHGSMGVQDQHFDLVLELAVETLEDHEVGSEHIEGLAQAFESYRSAIVMGGEAGA
jgi:truncated hemoglobin YjbI